MNKRVFKSWIDGPETYTRVSKAYARKHWRDERIDICPVNLRPGGGFHSNMTMRPTGTFDYIVLEFTWDNCTCDETGRYAAFYRVT